MTARTASRLAWSLWGRRSAAGRQRRPLGPGDTLGDTGVFVFVPDLPARLRHGGRLIAARQPGNAIGWVFIGTGLAWAVLGAADARRIRARHRSGGILRGSRRRLGEHLVLRTGIFLPVTLLPVVPGRAGPSPRWRPVLWIAILSNLGVLLGNAFDPATDTVDARFTSNPFGVDALEQVMKTSWCRLPSSGDRLRRRPSRWGCVCVDPAATSGGSCNGSRTRASSSCWRSPARSSSARSPGGNPTRRRRRSASSS